MEIEDLNRSHPASSNPVKQSAPDIDFPCKFNFATAWYTPVCRGKQVASNINCAGDFLIGG